MDTFTLSKNSLLHYLHMRYCIYIYIYIYMYIYICIIYISYTHIYIYIYISQKNETRNMNWLIQIIAKKIDVNTSCIVSGTNFLYNFSFFSFLRNWKKITSFSNFGLFQNDFIYFFAPNCSQFLIKKYNAIA